MGRGLPPSHPENNRKVVPIKLGLCPSRTATITLCARDGYVVSVTPRLLHTRGKKPGVYCWVGTAAGVGVM